MLASSDGGIRGPLPSSCERSPDRKEAHKAGAAVGPPPPEYSLNGSMGLPYEQLEKRTEKLEKRQMESCTFPTEISLLRRSTETQDTLDTIVVETHRSWGMSSAISFPKKKEGQIRICKCTENGRNKGTCPPAHANKACILHTERADKRQPKKDEHGKERRTTAECNPNCG